MKYAKVAVLVLLLAALPATGYQILLDIDTDGNPNTINQFTEESTAIVKMVLVPDGGSEWISDVQFGLGGTCWMCWETDFHMYGTSTDLYLFWPDPWLDDPLWGENWADYALCIDCCGNPGFHHLYFATAAGGGFLLTGNMFLKTFTAWDIDHPVCEEPPPDLMAFACDWEPCNTIMLSGYVPVRESDWSSVKALY